MEQCFLCTLTFLPQSDWSSFTPSAASFKSSLISITSLGSTSPESTNVCQMETLEWLGRFFYSVGETDLDSVVRVLKIECHCHRSSQSTRANIENPAKNESRQAHFADDCGFVRCSLKRRESQEHSQL